MEDSIESDLLLHVVDVSDPFLYEKMDVVDKILDEIGAKQLRILVFNKVDLISKEQYDDLKEKFPDKNIVWISVTKWWGIEFLKETLVKFVKSCPK